MAGGEPEGQGWEQMGRLDSREVVRSSGAASLSWYGDPASWQAPGRVARCPWAAAPAREARARGASRQPAALAAGPGRGPHAWGGVGGTLADGEGVPGRSCPNRAAGG
jgi:hypothetical protein